MILPVAVARGVAEGDVDRVYRRWARSRIVAGSTLRTAAGVATGDLDEVVATLDRMDRRSRRGPWTRPTLRLVAELPGVRAAELAERAGRDTLAFKRDVRALKELGLTESLETGYRLSPRGAALLARS